MVGFEVITEDVLVQYHLPYLQNQPLQPPKDATKSIKRTVKPERIKFTIAAFLKLKAMN